MREPLNTRETLSSDKKTIVDIHTQAFGKEEGPIIAKLVQDLFNDSTALPLFSLLGFLDNKPAGHILFTKVSIDRFPKTAAQILAPLAVLPEVQKKGIGKQLIHSGLDLLASKGVELVFVLGHPEYYPKCGFTPAGVLGFDAPYSIPEKNADAWMVAELKNGAMKKGGGVIQCAKALDHPEYWRE